MASGPIPADLEDGDKEKVRKAATLICSKTSKADIKKHLDNLVAENQINGATELSHDEILSKAGNISKPLNVDDISEEDRKQIEDLALEIWTANRELTDDELLNRIPLSHGNNAVSNVTSGYGNEISVGNIESLNNHVQVGGKKKRKTKSKKTKKTKKTKSRKRTTSKTKRACVSKK